MTVTSRDTLYVLYVRKQGPLMNVYRYGLVVLWLVIGLSASGCRRSAAAPAPSPTAAARQAAAITIQPTATANPPTPTATPTAPPTQTPTPAPTLTPTIVIADWHQADTWQQHGDYALAIRGYRALLARGPSPADQQVIAFRLGESYLLNGEPGAAADVLSDYVTEHPDDATAWFLLGRAREALEDWGGTVEAFDAYRQLDAALADYAGLRMAAALEELGRWDEATTTYTDVAAATPDGDIAAEALTLLAELALDRDDPLEAAGRYAEASARSSDDGDKARRLALAGTAYVAADAETEAVPVLLQVVEAYPATEGAYVALGELLLLDQPVNQRLQGIIYYYNHAYRAAADVLTDYLVSEPAPRGDALYFVGRSYEDLGEWASAINAYDRLIENYPTSDRFGAAWVRKARAQLHIGEAEAAVNTFRQFAQTRPGDILADNALWEAARALEDLNRDAEAAELHLAILSGYPHGDVAAEAGFRAGILPYLVDEYTQAREAWHLAARQLADLEARARVLLWAGKAALMLDDSAAATADLDAAVRAAPLSFDGLRARELLGQPAPDAAPMSATTASWLGLDDEAVAAIDSRLQNDPHFERGLALLEVGLREAGLEELRTLRNAYWNLPAHMARLAHLLDTAPTRNLSISCAERALILTGVSPLSAPAELARLAYPADYDDLVVDEATQYGFDARLLAALIRQESRFDVTATSYADARGLTQVIPPTGEYVAAKLGLRDFAVETLYRPYQSLAFGAWYLDDQLERFDDPLLALAAYNGGPGNARRWQVLTDDPDMLVASIHLSQTRTYVRRVMEQYAVYRALYDAALLPR